MPGLGTLTLTVPRVSPASGAPLPLPSVSTTARHEWWKGGEGLGRLRGTRWSGLSCCSPTGGPQRAGSPPDREYSAHRCRQGTDGFGARAQRGSWLGGWELNRMIRTILPLVLELFYSHVLFPAYLLVTSLPASPPIPSPNKGPSLHSSLGEPFFEELE